MSLFRFCININSAFGLKNFVGLFIYASPLHVGYHEVISRYAFEMEELPRLSYHIRKREVEASASLQRCVVWDGERVAAGTTAENAVFANGQFHTMAEHA